MVGNLVGAVCPLSLGNIQTWTGVVTGSHQGGGCRGEEDRRERDSGLPTFFLFGSYLSFPLFTY